MLTRVMVINQAGRSVDLPLFDVASPYIVTDISGLDPVKAEISSTPFATRDGSQFQSSRRAPRDIVLKVGLENGYGAASVRDLRHKLYSVCMPQTRVSIRFYDDNVHYATIDGLVETCDASIFSRDPEMTVSIMCFDPDLRAPNDTVVLGSAIPSTMSSTGYFQYVDYQGSVPTGIRMQMTTDTPLRAVALSLRPSLTGSVRHLSFKAPSPSFPSLAAGSLVDVLTVPGTKHAASVLSKSSRSMLPMLTRDSTWIALRPGPNYFLVTHDGPSILTYKLIYRTRYGGL